jgi:hypothetical protein
MPSGDPNDAGSGKFKTPWERMHVAYSTSGPPEAEPPAALAAEGVAVVVVPRLATPAVEPPPQAAVASARPMTAGAPSHNRRQGPHRGILRVYTQRIAPVN